LVVVFVKQVIDGFKAALGVVARQFLRRILQAPEQLKLGDCGADKSATFFIALKLATNSRFNEVFL
jgi:hypothetical protein